MAELVVTHTSTVAEDQIDHLGHMNVRFYGVNARAATLAFVADHAPVAGVGDATSIELVDVYTRHHREQLVDARLSVSSGALGAEPGRLRLYHELRNDDTGELAATFVHVVEAHGPEGPLTTWPPAPADVIEIPPPGRPRSIALDTDPISSSPSLASVRDRGLAMRRPREVEADECDERGRVQAGTAPFLLWGGEPLEGATGPSLHDGPDGAVIGWASMETRLVIRRLPRLGDRIQSFGATVAIADKTTQQVMWAFDVDRGDLLCSFEVINLAFDTVGRRAVTIPDELRTMSERRLHEDLLPR